MALRERLILVLAGLMGMVAALAGCDEQGKAVVPAPASGPRIVVLSPAVGVILRDLGAGGTLVGRHGFDAWSDQSLPVCGDQSGPDLEQIERARPTHVFVQPTGGVIPPALVERAAKRGWQVRSFPILALDDISSAVRELGEVTGRRDRALELAAECAAAWPVSAPLPSPTSERVLLLYSTDPPTTFGPGSFHYQALERIGARPAITTGRPFITLDAETIRRLAPEVIVLVQPREPGKPAADPGPATVLARLGGLSDLDLPAVKTQRLVLIDDPEATLPGTNMLRFTRLLRQAVSRSAEATPASPPR